MSARTLPRHPRTGIAAVGYRKPRRGEDRLRRYPIWPILGGAEDDSGDGDSDDQDDDAEESDTDDKGGDDKGVDHSAEVEKWKATSRKHEARAKENAAAAKELARIKREGMPEHERKVAEAVAKAVAEVNAKNGARLARQAFLAAAKGVLPNPGEVADDVNLNRYVNDDGEIDEDGLAELVKRLAPKGSDKDDDQDDDERDTRRRRRQGDSYQGTRRRSGGGRHGGSVADGRDLYRELLGGGSKDS